MASIPKTPHGDEDAGLLASDPNTTRGDEEGGLPGRDFVLEPVKRLWLVVKSAAKQVFAAGYIFFWSHKFSWIQSLGAVVGIILLVLILIEVAQLLFELLPALLEFSSLWLSPEARKWLHDSLPELGNTVRVLLFISGCLMVYHHRRLEVRLSRHRTLLDMLRKVALDSVAGKGPQSAQDLDSVVNKALESLILAVQFKNHRKPCVSAALLLRNSLEQDFQVYRLMRRKWPDKHDRTPQTVPAQYPAGYKISGKSSAAARVCNQNGDPKRHYKEEDSLYVPWTRCRHGAKITIQPTRSGHNQTVQRFSQVEKSAMTMNIIPNSPDFLPCSQEGARRSLLLYKVPVEGENGLSAVMSVETNRRACLGELDFLAIQSIGMILGSVVKESNGTLWGKAGP